jgi:hypothetical protein
MAQKITDTIFEQILAIRDTGKTNMFDTATVQKLAFDLEFYELVNLLEEDKKSYSTFIISGDRGGSDEQS